MVYKVNTENCVDKYFKEYSNACDYIEGLIRRTSSTNRDFKNAMSMIEENDWCWLDEYRRIWIEEVNVIE